MILKVYTAKYPYWNRPYYLAWFVDVLDSDILLVRCVSKDEIHEVKRKNVVTWEA